MGRFITVQIEGEEFPLYFSVLAMEKIYDEFGNMQGMMTAVMEEKNPARQFSKILDVLKFENYAAIKLLESEGETGKTFDKETLLAKMNPFKVNAAEYWARALECINEGQEQEVETEPDLKNAEAK